MIYGAIDKIIGYALKKKLISEYDIYVVRNYFIDVLCLDEYKNTDSRYNDESVDELLFPLIEYACENGIIDDTSNSRDLFDTKLMGILTPMPREVARVFEDLRNENPRKATEWYYSLSKDLNYVREGRIARNLTWQYECEYGNLDITINRSKPEIDPRDIEKQNKEKISDYPLCPLCPENAGYKGDIKHQARQNLRPLPINIRGERWQLQYSPYGYYNEHCIAFNEKHVPMIVDENIFDKLIDIVDYLPHYFMGSNADLTIVGGSILNHEHFQGGNYSFTIEKAGFETEFEIKDYPDVKAGILNWPVSVIRLISENRKSLSECSAYVFSKWKNYSDESVGIIADTNGIPHNTITPIMRKNGDFYECDIALRNNITTTDKPFGVFHSSSSLHHIKKENIGLIEVMGLAVLPARLEKEFFILKKAMLSGENLYDIPEIKNHAEWGYDILNRYPDFSEENADEILKTETGKAFFMMLCDSAVFKKNDEGRKAFRRFIDAL